MAPPCCPPGRLDHATKAKVEVGVQVVERWILARLRNETFFSLEALNERIAEVLVDINERRMRRYDASRRELFERLDKPALMALPSEAFTYAEWKTARLNIDYHVEVDHHFYSAPHALVHEQLDVRFGAATVELFHKNQRVASHPRSFGRGRHTTDPTHMPKAHQKHLEWTPTRIIEWAGTIGPSTAELAQAILAEPTPRARLPLVPRNPAALQELRQRTPRSRVRPRAHRPGALLPPRRVDLEERPRPLARHR